MRMLLLLALALVAAGIYLASVNDGSVTFHLTKERAYTLPTALMLILTITLGLAIGVGATLLKDFQSFVSKMNAKRHERTTDKVRTLFLAGERERLAGRPAKAREAYRKVIKLRPEHVAATARLGDLARDHGAAKEAISLHRLAARLEPDNPVHLLALIDDYIAMEAYENAARHLEMYLQEDPRNQTLLIRLRQVHVANRDWEAAATAQERLTQTEMDGLDSRAEAATLTGFRYEAAMALLADGRTDQARTRLGDLARKSAFGPAALSLSRLYAKEGRAAEALELCREAYEQTRDESFLPEIENLFIVKLEAPRDAVQYFTDLVRRDPESLHLRYYLARIHYRLEMIDDALHVLSQVEHQVVRFPEMSDLLARINLRRGDVTEALVNLGDGGPRLPWGCRNCNAAPEFWEPRCTNCGHWAAIRPRLHIVKRETGEPRRVLPAPA
ncbi:MAG: tetratricopeptide repeat protein [Nitrospirota bacterium]|nr:tetratricopeptide repeat protein [Nitrospirota bacterium]